MIGTSASSIDSLADLGRYPSVGPATFPLLLATLAHVFGRAAFGVIFMPDEFIQASIICYID